jgi:hypothetical protein
MIKLKILNTMKKDTITGNSNVLDVLINMNNSSTYSTISMTKKRIEIHYT